MNKIFALIIASKDPYSDDDTLCLVGAETEAQARQLATPLVPDAKFNYSIYEVVEMPGTTAVTGLICTYSYATLKMEKQAPVAAH